MHKFEDYHPYGSIFRFLFVSWYGFEYFQSVFFIGSSFAFSSVDERLNKMFLMLLKGASMKRVIETAAAQTTTISLRSIIDDGVKNRMSLILAIDSWKIGI